MIAGFFTLVEYLQLWQSEENVDVSLMWIVLQLYRFKYSKFKLMDDN